MDDLTTGEVQKLLDAVFDVDLDLRFTEEMEDSLYKSYSSIDEWVRKIMIPRLLSWEWFGDTLENMYVRGYSPIINPASLGWHKFGILGVLPHTLLELRGAMTPSEIKLGLYKSLVIVLDGE